MEGPGFVIGNIAKGKDLWDRHEEIKSIWRALEKSSVLLKAPRRFGKSSIMYHLYENPQPDCTVFFHDTEGMKSPEDFITGIMANALVDSRFKKFLKSTVKWGKNIFKLVEEVDVAEVRIKIRDGIKDNWQEKGLELISTLREFDRRIIFILDELPMLVQNIEKKHNPQTAFDFLHWFRSVRQMPDMEKIRWIVGGSIGIEHILERIKAGTKTINDFHILSVGAFSIEDGTAYVKALLKNEGQLARIQPAIIEKILDIVGAPVPYFLQILVYESLNEMRLKQRTLNKEIIERAYFEKVLGPASRTYFEHYFTRLKDYYDEHCEHVAKRLILEVARKGKVDKNHLFKLFRQTCKGKLTDEIFSHLMTDIENDFYVSYSVNTKTYSFTTNVLREWWLRYYDLVEE
ncbi:MAG: hypothetical protein C4538_02580 [Nitrospiraceae bacterium]|nr:MAG: hypothetical protein C4538_02580 [Nitrospiraceae bacterium]